MRNMKIGPQYQTVGQLQLVALQLSTTLEPERSRAASQEDTLPIAPW
jgi:hypothetical protein